jgi:predicted nucleotidyltransferase
MNNFHPPDTLFKIYDNIFDPKTIDTLYGSFRDYKPWNFIGHATEETEYQWRKFSYILNPEDKIDSILYRKADEIINRNNLSASVERGRAYASGSVYGTINPIHTDDTSENYNEIITVMFYLNKTWSMNHAGETIFLSKDENEIWKAIIPKPGRAVLFDGFVPHGAREISRTCVELRMVATIRYRKK